jgi:threonyl-tRNA synthetase
VVPGLARARAGGAGDRRRPHLEFAESLADKRIRAAGLRVEVDPSNEKLTAKIRTASLLRPPYIGVIGDKELESDGATLRKGRTDLGFLSPPPTSSRG